MGITVKDVTSFVAPVLAIAAIIVYSMFSILYDSFYGRLGVDPREVGLGFKETIAGSTGVALLVVPAVALTYWLTVLCIRNASLPAMALLGVTSVGSIVLLVFLAVQAGRSQPVRAVQEGRPVEPVTLGPLMLVPLHAEPARISAIGKPPEQTRAIDDLRTHRLVYLGASGGVAVLYDSDEQQVVRVHQSTALILTVNCQSTSYRGPDCPAG